MQLHHTPPYYEIIFDHTSTAKENENFSYSAIQRASSLLVYESYYNSAIHLLLIVNANVRNHELLYHDLAQQYIGHFQQYINKRNNSAITNHATNSHPPTEPSTFQDHKMSTTLDYPSNGVILQLSLLQKKNSLSILTRLVNWSYINYTREEPFCLPPWNSLQQEHKRLQYLKLIRFEINSVSSFFSADNNFINKVLQINQQHERKLLLRTFNFIRENEKAGQSSSCFSFPVDSRWKSSSGKFGHRALLAQAAAALFLVTQKNIATNAVCALATLRSLSENELA